MASAFGGFAALKSGVLAGWRASAGAAGTGFRSSRKSEVRCTARVRVVVDLGELRPAGADRARERPSGLCKTLVGPTTQTRVLSVGPTHSTPSPRRRRSSSRSSNHAGPRAGPSCAASVRRCWPRRAGPLPSDRVGEDGEAFVQVLIIHDQRRDQSTRLVDAGRQRERAVRTSHSRDTSPAKPVSGRTRLPTSWPGPRRRRPRLLDRHSRAPSP